MRRTASVLVLLAVSVCGFARQAVDEAKLKPDASGLSQRFAVFKERFDPDKRQYTWVLEARVTAETPCHYDAEFLDADDRVVTTVKVEFEDGGKRTEKGARYRAWIKYPTRKTMEKVTQVTVKKSD